MSNTKGRGVLEVTTDLLEELFRQGNEVRYRVSEHGLPDDARIVGARFDPEKRMLYLTVESASYPVPLGGPLDAGPITPPLLPPFIIVLPDPAGATQA